MALPSADAEPQYQAALEGLPHIMQKICLMWGTRELEIFIGRMIMDSRGGSRQGFPMAAAHEMMFLAETNRIIRAIDTAKSLNIKLPEAYKMVVAGDEAAVAPVSWDDPAVTMDTISRKKPQPTANEQISQAAKGAEGSGPFYWFGRVVFKPWFIVLLVVVLSFKAWMPTLNKYLSLVFY